MRIYSTSSGLDVGRLVPGQDLVLSVDRRHGLALPMGVGAQDHLDLEMRGRADVLAREAMAEWRSHCEPYFGLEGLNWPFVWEWPLFRWVFAPVLTAALGVKAALGAYQPQRVEWGDPDHPGEDVVGAAATSSGLEFSVTHGGRVASPEAYRRRVPLLRRIRQALFNAPASAGIPTRLRQGSVLVLSYWPMMPVLDRMLRERRWQPAIFADWRPAGISRSLRSAAQGGWIGRPGRRALAQAAARMEEAIAAASAQPPRIDIEGMALGPALHRRCVEFIRRRGADDLAMSAIFRRALERHRPRALLVPYDHNPRARLYIWLAREAGVPTVVVQHGAYLIPSEMNDMTFADVAAIWSRAVAPPIEFARDPWVMGYPLPHDPPPPTRVRREESRPRVLVLAQAWDPASASLDPRDVMRHGMAALTAVSRALPGATVILRPHPDDDPRIAQDLVGGSERVRVDVRTDLLELLRTSDICIGAVTSGTLQSALVGTPVVVLNVTGREWRWPLGGETTVPIARSGEELAVWLERWGRGERLPGREDLLSGLGVTDRDASRYLLEQLERLRLPAQDPKTLVLPAASRC